MEKRIAQGSTGFMEYPEENPNRETGTRGEGRTLNLRLRRPTLYPIELLAQDTVVK